ncbi:MAG: UbiX family flavin prenyltransferase [Pirellulaceae bacterium]|nr:UbiX family flavin prenyltransferase [Pirellulaceae bacterium]
MAKAFEKQRDLTPSHDLPVVLGITGASGAIYAARTLQWLLQEGLTVHLVVSRDGLTVVRHELGYHGEMRLEDIPAFFEAAGRILRLDTRSVAPVQGLEAAIDCGKLHIHQPDDYFVPIASGSYRTRAMVVCPCSGSTLAAIAHSLGRNLVHRAAEVHLKERRKLIVVPRETPLSTMQIENMQRVAAAGAVVLPASPGWYHGVSSLSDLVDFVAARILDQLDVSHQRSSRWQAIDES